MKTITTLLLAAGMLAAAGSNVFVGVITDTMCGADHKHMGIAPADKCVRECVRHGAKYALYDGKEIYRLSDQQTPEKFAARKVKVTGVLFAKTKIIKVEKIEAAE